MWALAGALKRERRGGGGGSGSARCDYQFQVSGATGEEIAFVGLDGAGAREVMGGLTLFVGHDEVCEGSICGASVLSTAVFVLSQLFQVDIPTDREGVPHPASRKIGRLAAERLNEAVPAAGDLVFVFIDIFDREAPVASDLMELTDGVREELRGGGFEPGVQGAG